MEFLTDTIFTEFGRTDYIGGIDNEALDFGQLDQFIQGTSGAVTNGPDSSSASTGNDGSVDGNCGTVSGQEQQRQQQRQQQITLIPGTTAILAIATTPASQTRLPESPPDSGSEPPYSPADIQCLTVAATPVPITNVGDLRQPENDNLSTLTDLTPTNAIDLHQNHLSLLSTHHQQQHLEQRLKQQHHHHHHHQQQHQQHHQNALYIRSDLVDATDLQNQAQQHLQLQSGSVGELTLCKQEDMLLHHQPPEMLLQPLQQSQNSHLCEAFRSDVSHYNVLTLGGNSSSINSNDLSRLMSNDCYSPLPATSTPTPSSTILNQASCQLTQIAAAATAAPYSRKRKISCSADFADTTSLVKPEPSAALSPMCQSESIQQHSTPSTVGNVLLNVDTSATTNNNGGSASGSVIGDTSLSSHNLDPIGGAGSGNTSGSEACPLQCIRFSPFQQQNWHVLCDQSLQELPVPYYNVDADKGFNFSNSDDAFVCQKKNHFQITCHAKLHGDAAFVRTSCGLEKIKSFHLHFYGVKLETPNHMIRIEQSQSDRSKKPFHPVPIDLQIGMVSKITVVRLHFSETTSNNMRKKGRPNPEQRYFQLVVGLHAHTHSGHFPIVSHGSERIIVRASNPGQFESDVELCWQRGVTQDSIYHAGRVGINTDRPDESLVVHGNLKVSGHIVQPSDSRAKQEIGELDTRKQLENLQKIRIVRYRYEPEFAAHSGLKADSVSGEIVDTGVIAQEVRKILPDAVQEAGSVVLANGQVIENFLLVNKDRILMENIGAVKELCKVTGSLETRIEQLEKINSRLIRIQQFDRKHNCSTQNCKHLLDDDDDISNEICSNKTIQKVIIILIAVMAMCLLAMSALYFMEHQQHNDSIALDNILSHVRGGNNQNYIIGGGNQQKKHLSDIGSSGRFPSLTYSSSSSSSSIPPLADDHKTYDPNSDVIDIPSDIRYQYQSNLPPLPPVSTSKQPKNIKSNPLLKNNNNNNNIQLELNGYDTADNTILAASAPPGDESFSEKAIDTNSNLPPNSFEGERKKLLIVKNKQQKSSIPVNTKRTQYTTRYVPAAASAAGGTPQQVTLSQSSGTLIPLQQTIIDPAESIVDTNKNQLDAIEEQDLQNLNNSSDLGDQLLSIETSQHTATIFNSIAVNRTVRTQIVGIPENCENIKSETIKCQSLCCEQSNRLFDTIKFVDIHLNSNRTTTRENFLCPTSSSSSSSASSISVSVSSAASLLQSNGSNSSSNQIDAPLPQQQQQQQHHRATPIINHVVTVEAGSLNQPLRNKHKSTEINDKIHINDNSAAITAATGCYPIQLIIRSELFNMSLVKENVCRSGEQLHPRNFSYTIPISKFMQETKIELYFLGPNTLQWTLCNRKDSNDVNFSRKLDNGSSVTSTSSSSSLTGSSETQSLSATNAISSLSTSSDSSANNIIDDGILQINPSKSIFHLHLPNYGHFERHFQLRAGFDFKSTCQKHEADDPSKLQYNIRIFRDCD